MEIQVIKAMEIQVRIGDTLLPILKYTGKTYKRTGINISAQIHTYKLKRYGLKAKPSKN